MTTPNRPIKKSSGSQSQGDSQSRQSSILGFFRKKTEQTPVVPKPDFKYGSASKLLGTPVPSSDPVEPVSSPLIPSKSSFTSSGMGKENGTASSPVFPVDFSTNLCRND